MKVELPPSIIQKVQTMADRSIQIKLATREISPEAMTQLFQALNHGEAEIVTEIESGAKSPSKRLYDKIFVYWKSRDDYQKTYPDANSFYRNYMEQIMKTVQDKIDNTK